MVMPLNDSKKTGLTPLSVGSTGVSALKLAVREIAAVTVVV